MSDDWEQLQGALTKLDAAEAEVDRLREALSYLADPESWLGDPHDQTSTLHGHFTPFELAVQSLSEPLDKEEG